MIDKVKSEGWEGFVLRKPGEKSRISFTMDGKAYRQGAWKYKFIHEDDFVITGADYGKSGRHADIYAQFNISQYVDGELVSFGNCGPGKLKHEELVDLTHKINSGAVSLPLVAEIEYQSRQEDTGKLEFPQLVRFRLDKTPEECICNEIFE